MAQTPVVTTYLRRAESSPEQLRQPGRSAADIRAGDLVSLSPEREAAGTRPWLSSEISEEENHHHMGADVRVSLTKTGNNTGQH